LINTKPGFNEPHVVVRNFIIIEVNINIKSTKGPALLVNIRWYSCTFGRTRGLSAVFVLTRHFSYVK